MEDASGNGWDLSRLQSRDCGMLKAGARVVEHGSRPRAAIFLGL
jgi:hypothetical protein